MFQIIEGPLTLTPNPKLVPLRIRNPKMGTLANSENPDEISHNAAFHQGLHCLLRKINLQGKNFFFLFEIITFDRSIYTMDILT